MADDQVKCAVKLEGVTKSFRRGRGQNGITAALRGVDLCVREGELFGLLGPNGAGKSTLLNLSSSLLLPDQGSITVLGQRLGSLTVLQTGRLRARMNMSSGNPNFPWSLTVTEILNFYGMLYGIRKAQRKERIGKYLELLGLQEAANKVYDRLSTGTKQRLALAKALLNEPELLFLDEPTVGLDPDIALRIREFIRKFHAQTGRTIILTTHYMKEAEQLCQRIAFLSHGRIVAEGTNSELKNKLHAGTLEEVFLELAH